MKNKNHRKIIIIVYILLLGLSALFILNHGLSSPLWLAIQKGTADPFGLTIFIIMGLYPLSFYLSNFIIDRNITKIDWILILLSFFLGSFVLYPSYFKAYTRKDRPHSVFPLLGVWFGLGTSLMIIVYGFLVGDSTLFFAAFLTDALVFLMTLDFIALTLLSVLLAKENTVNWKFTFIPLIGWWGILLD